jgi:hypothetical protein
VTELTISSAGVDLFKGVVLEKHMDLIFGS